MVLGITDEQVPFPNYDFKIATIAVKGVKTKFRVVFDEGQLVSVVKKNYKAIPHKLVYDTALTIANERNFSVIPRFTAISPDRTKMVVTLLGAETFYFENDKYRLGLTICNSYDYTTALTASLYLHREICSNGLFMPISLNVPAVRIKHTGDINTIISRYIDGIHNLFDAQEIVIDFLRLLKEKQVTANIVKALLSKLPAQVLIKFAKIQNINDIEITKKATMLDLLNEYTYQFTHQLKMNAAIAYRHQRNIVNAIVRVARGEINNES